MGELKSQTTMSVSGQACACDGIWKNSSVPQWTVSTTIIVGTFGKDMSLPVDSEQTYTFTNVWCGDLKKFWFDLHNV